MAVRVVAEPSAEAATVERFLAAFSRIEAHLRREVKADKYLGFADLVARLGTVRNFVCEAVTVRDLLFSPINR